MDAARDRHLAGCQACGQWDKDGEGRLMCVCPPDRYREFHAPPQVEIVIRGPGHCGKSTLARLIRAGILDAAGLFVAPVEVCDTYRGAGEDCLPLAQAIAAEALILRRLWPHIRIRTEDLP